MILLKLKLTCNDTIFAYSFNYVRFELLEVYIIKIKGGKPNSFEKS